MYACTIVGVHSVLCVIKDLHFFLSCLVCECFPPLPLGTGWLRIYNGCFPKFVLYLKVLGFFTEKGSWLQREDGIILPSSIKILHVASSFHNLFILHTDKMQNKEMYLGQNTRAGQNISIHLYLPTFP